MVIIFASDSNRVKLLPLRASHLARSMAQHRLHPTPEAVPSRCQRPDSQNKPEQITKYNTFNMTIKHNQDSLPDLATHDLANIALCDWCPNICRKQLPRRRQAPESQLHHRIADRRMLAAHAHAGCLPSQILALAWRIPPPASRSIAHMVELAQWSRPIELCRICRILSSFCRALTYCTEYVRTDSRSPSPFFPEPFPSLMLVCALGPPFCHASRWSSTPPQSSSIPALELPPAQILGQPTGTTQTISRPNKLHISTDASPAAIQVIDAPHSHPGLTSTPTNAPSQRLHDIFGSFNLCCLTLAENLTRYHLLSAVSSSAYYYVTFRTASASHSSKTATVDFAIIFHDGERPELHSSPVRRLQPPNLPTPPAGSHSAISSSLRADKLNATNASSGQQRSDPSSRCTK